jgi:hypothetical protein
MRVHTAPLTGARIPDLTDSTDLAQWFSYAVNDLDDNATPSFASAAARDTAYSNWVSAGNTMRDGLVCTVAGNIQVYRSSAWRGTSTLYYNTTAVTAWTTAVADDNVRVIASIAIPDPGWPYRIRSFGEFEATGAGGGRVDSLMGVGSSTWDIYATTPNQFYHHRHAYISPVTFTGGQALEMRAYRATPGVGTWTSTGANFGMSCEIVPV